MSYETDFRAVLTGYAGLTSLVPAARIAQNAVTQGSSLPLVVFVARAVPELGLNNSVHGVEVNFDVECYADTAASASAVAAAVQAAIAAQTAYVVTDGPTTAFDSDLEIDAVTLTVQRWIT